MSVTGKALFVIERNHNRDLTLEEIATACGVTKYHLAHAFGQTTNLSVMQYTRGPRLTEAARVLERGSHDILDLALQSGYASHEAFTRAFRQQLGAAPESVRSAGSLDGLAVVEPMTAPSRGAVEVTSPRARRRSGNPACWVASPLFLRRNRGYCRSMAAVHDLFVPGIPAHSDAIPGIPLGVASNVDADGGFDYICAAEVSAFATLPPDCVRVSIPAHRYAIFEHRDHISTIQQTYGAIWDEWLPAHRLASADAPSIERHNKETFDPRTGNGGVDIWGSRIGRLTGQQKKAVGPNTGDWRHNQMDGGLQHSCVSGLLAAILSAAGALFLTIIPRNTGAAEEWRARSFRQATVGL